MKQLGRLIPSGLRDSTAARSDPLLFRVAHPNIRNEIESKYSPIATLPDDSFTTDFKAFPWHETVGSVTFYFFIWIARPMNLLQLPVAKEDNEVAAFPT